MNQIFYDSLTEGPWKDERRKTHFHKFMLRIHAEMHAARYQDHIAGDAILPAVIAKEVSAGRLLCFDEFQVTDVADAMTPEALKADLLAALGDMFGRKLPEATGFVAANWSRDAFAGGAYSVIAPGSTPADFATLAQGIDNRLFLTGEHTDFSYHATVHGAYLSGLRTAKAILALAR